MLFLQALTLSTLCAAAMTASLAPPDCTWQACKPSFFWNETACDCMCTLLPDVKPDWFQQEVWGHWFRMPCSAGTFYNSAECSCSLLAPAKKPGQSFPTPQAGASSPTCLKLVDLQLNGSDFVDLTRNWIDAENAANISVVDAVNATDGKAAVFAGNAVVLPVFEYNDLTSTAQIELRFQPGLPVTANVTQVVFSNACPEEPEPSLALTYTASRSELNVTLGTQLNTLTASCHDHPDESGWYTLVLAVEKSLGRVFLNGRQCAMEMQGGGAITKTPCGLTIGGDPLASDNDNHFFGLLDYFTVEKHCVTM